MKTKCVPGDLAFIIRDEPGCEANIGRIVAVHGPLRLTSDRGPEWIIVPVNQAPFCYSFTGEREVIHEVISLGRKVRHSDAWLSPIRPQSLRSATTTDEESNQELAMASV